MGLKMFYVLYSPSARCYLNELGDFANYSSAEKFNSKSPCILNNARLYAKDAIWVGPCNEGEEP